MLTLARPLEVSYSNLRVCPYPPLEGRTYVGVSRLLTSQTGRETG
jgi:hypothetical protein